MRFLTVRALRTAALGLALVACNSDRVAGPSASPAIPSAPTLLQAQSAGPSVRIAEFHYDNPSTDANERIEISGPAGTDLTGWSVVRYNGSTPSAAVVYTSPAGPTISGTIPATCGSRGVLVFSYPQDGLQNGGSDGFALVNNLGQVVELLSYEGTLVASNGAAAGMTSVDVGVSESGLATAPAVSSIQRQPNGTWLLATSTAVNFGVCNDDDSGITATVDHITVTPASATVTVGGTQQYTATAYDASNVAIPGTSFTWGTSSSSVATVGVNGLATGAGAGDANITATSGSVVGTATIHVDAAAVVDHIVIAPADVTVTQGATQQFTATAYDAANNTIPGTTFTWASSNTAVATVNTSGLATSVSVGDANITATSGSVIGTGVLHVSAPSYTPPNIRVSEIHYDNTGTDAGEAVEIEGPVGTSLAGWSIAFYNGDPASSTTPLKVYMTSSLSGTLAAPVACNNRGVRTFAIANIQNGGLNGSQPDGLALVDNNGALVEFLSYEGSFTAADGPAIGVTSRNLVVMEDNPTPAAAPVASLQRSGDGQTWTGPAANNFDYVNACGAPPPPQFTIQFSGRATPADPPLPVGFEAQIFASEKNGTATVSTTITWSSDTPAIATIDQDGVFRALTAGTAVLRATATDGTTGTVSLPTVVGTQSSAPYGGNTEFGDPIDGDASNDFIIRRLEYTSSFNQLLGRPNWVAAKLDATTYGAEDRCNCFTFDPELVAAGFTPYTTADYTGAGAFAGYGIDRGHMTRSADRTAGNLDNARTYYFSNVMPQAAANNQVTWKLLEDTLGVVAQNQGKEIYTIMGGSSSATYPSRGTLKNEGKVEMPGAVWKVAVILPHGKGLADVHHSSDVQIIAVIMPNDPGIGTDWHAFRTTVDAVEALSGYDLLNLLDDNIEAAVESGDAQPVAHLTGPTTGAEGSTLAFDASTSSDADVGDALTYAWNFGDGSTATGANASHAYADNGSYTVTLTVTDSHGVYDVATQAVTVSNVNPAATFSAPAGPITEGATFTLNLTSATDASSVDQGSLTYAFDCGDGAGYGAASSTASVTCTAKDDPSSAVKGKVIDKDGGESEYTASVPVTNALPVITSFTVTPAFAASGTTVTAEVNFTDAGAVDAHTVVIDWGDGSSSTVNAALAAQATATHAYAGAGFYTVGVTVTDDDSGAATSSAAVSMYNPAGGYLNGKGMVEGIGAAAGLRASFSIDLGYVGGTTPVGSFRIIGSSQIKNMNSASTFDYLIISGNVATFSGTGTLIDGTAVKFYVRGADLGSTPSNPTDKLRVKVMNAATGAVLFDTQPGDPDLAAPASPVSNGYFTIKH